MKKIIGITLLMAVLIIHGQTFSQSLADISWRLQNPQSIYTNETLSFGSPISEVGKIESTVVDIKNNVNSQGNVASELLVGNWQQSRDSVIINFHNGTTLSYKIEWVTTNTIK
jgi:hypothetical protein